MHYLNQFLKQTYAANSTELKFRFDYVIELDDTFEEQIRNSKIRGVTISVVNYNVSRRLANASGFFKYSRRNQAQMEVVLELKAKRKMNLPNLIKNAILGASEDKIKVEKVTIENQEGNIRTIHPEIFKKIKKISDLPNENNLNEVKYTEVIRELHIALGELDE